MFHLWINDLTRGITNYRTIRELERRGELTNIVNNLIAKIEYQMWILGRLGPSDTDYYIEIDNRRKRYLDSLLHYLPMLFHSQN